MATLLAIDAGNTNVVIGAYRGAELVATWRTATDHDRTEDELAVTLDALLGQEDLSLGSMDALVLGSVVPPLTQAFTRLADRYLEGKAVVIGPGVKTGVRLRVDNPSEVGADRIANTLAEELEMVFLMTAPEYLFLSASRVKELVSFGAPVDKLVPPNVAKALAKKAKPGLRTGATEPTD